MTGPTVSRRTAIKGLAGIGLAAALPLSRAWADSDGPSLNFLAVGDWGREGNFHQRDVAERMAESARELNARFVISVGDNFYDDGVTGIDDPQWRASFENVYDAPSLQVPWHAILGNHDYHGNSQAQLDYSAISRRWHLPARWYSREELAPDNTRIGLFFIDTSPMISDYYDDGAKTVRVGPEKPNVERQLTWLEQELSRSAADWKVVIGHHPVYSGRDRKGAQIKAGEPSGSPDLIARLDPILQRHRVRLYLNGHDHDLQHVLHGATHYVCTGAGSQTAERCEMAGSDFCSVQSGFVACAANRQRLRVAYRDYGGVELHVVDIPRAI
jgi:tartrate-resistant acid phosphatase type 5